ncbi:MAG: ADP-glyceromanno-heptose 6-epimerase [Aureispira sp.]|nr:ADP-glyceromanno-heptose 6-epimerase [Aureispira sp.]
MIVVTGAAGFIGSCCVSHLNQKGHHDLVIVDEFVYPEKNKNLEGKQFVHQIERNVFVEWFRENAVDIEFVFHLGARTDTTEKNKAIFDRLNLNYSKAIFELCNKQQIPLVYASSAATYGLGEHGYSDDLNPSILKPLNPYGDSKNDFDAWVLAQESVPPFWAGLKFFNVYGPNEFHKGRMASVIFHTHRQIAKTGKMKLFKSHRPDYKDGEQSRDFIYVKDLLSILYFLMEKRPASSLYNVGTGGARTFWDLAAGTFRAMGLEPDISFIDTPEDIRDTYQYFTEATMDKLREAGFIQPFYSLEEGIKDYVQNYLMVDKYY